MWIALILAALLISALGVFIWIARKGRELRRNQPLPPEATHALLQTSGKPNQQVIAPFYLGSSSECNVVLPDARANFEALIFYHNKRFAIQALAGAGILLVNRQEMIATYLRDGDVLTIANEEFTFRCS